MTPQHFDDDAGVRRHPTVRADRIWDPGFPDVSRPGNYYVP